MNPYKIDTGEDIPASHYMQQTIAIELAVGFCLPEMVRDWPIGLASAWNDAVDAGAFTQGCTTLGAMARAFLLYRLAKMGA